MQFTKNTILIFILFLSFSITVWAGDPVKENPPKKGVDMISLYEKFNKLGESNLSFEAYEKALVGFNSYKIDKGIISNVIAIIDFDLPSTEKRLFLINVESNKVLYSTYVAHGRNSGGNYATKFSNKMGSYQSSLGFYKTSEKYMGKHGVSLRLDGLEKGINDKARARGIVIHSADYVSHNFITRNKRLGRSLGCPALPKEDFKEVLNLLDDNILLYIHSSINF